MSSPVSWEHLAALATEMSTADQLRLVERIVHDVAAVDGTAVNGRHRSWREVRGIRPCPLCGEDAQAWVSRTRRDSDEGREATMSAVT
jgi:hypothetical protein